MNARSCTLCNMETHETSPANRAKLVRVRATWGAVLGEVLERGFHGRAVVELTIQDGTIQRIGSLVERIDR